MDINTINQDLTVALKGICAVALPTLIYIGRSLVCDFIVKHFNFKKMQLELSHAGINITSEKVSEIVNSTIENAIKALNISPVVNVPVEDKESLKQAENALTHEVSGNTEWIVGEGFIVKINGTQKDFYTPKSVGEDTFNILVERVYLIDGVVKTDRPFVEYLMS